MTTQAKRRRIFEGITVNLSDTESNFETISGWFHRLRARENFRHVNLSSEVATAEVKATESYPETCRKITEVGGYTAQKIYNVDKTRLFGKKSLYNLHFRRKKTKSGSKEATNMLRICLG